MPVITPKPIPLKVLPVYPVMDSLQEVLALAESQLPIVNSNDLKVLMMTYHNTLLSQIDLNQGTS